MTESGEAISMPFRVIYKKINLRLLPMPRLVILDIVFSAIVYKTWNISVRAAFVSVFSPKFAIVVSGKN